jgi:hypothetical protein
MRKELFISTVLFIGMVLFGACKKAEAPTGGGGGPQQPDLKRSFQLVLSELPGVPAPQVGLSAIVSITNAQGDTIVKNKRVSLNYDQQYYTDTLLSVKGNYNVSKFWILRDNDVLFATPVTGSVKAQLVSAPLPVQVSLVSSDHKLQSIGVARVEEKDKSEDFGYAAGEFGKPDTGPGDDPNAAIDIWIHPLIKIGDVVYDSVPVSVKMQTWDANGQVVTAMRTFSPGKNKISLLKSAAKHVFKIEKWGTSDELVLTKDQIQPNGQYVIGGSRGAKKLSEVLTAKIIQGVSRPETRTLYQYNGVGRVKEILTYRKKPDNSTYLDVKQVIAYELGRVENVTRYNEAGAQTGSTHFAYKTDGKLSDIVDFEGENRTTAEFSYLAGEGGTGISGDHTISAAYSYTGHYYTGVYSMYIRGGNMLESTLTQSNSRYEKGRYDYDFGINPYVHLGLPDLYLSNYSKHNRINETKEFFLDYPLVLAYQYSYKYDSDGYPIELVVKYRTYLTGEHAYDIKTLFKY